MITAGNAQAVLTWKAADLGLDPAGITLNLDEGTAWTDRFIEWPAHLGPIPSKAQADVWADEWEARTIPLKELADALGPGRAIEILATLLISKGVFMAGELRTALENG